MLDELADVKGEVHELKKTRHAKHIHHEDNPLRLKSQKTLKFAPSKNLSQKGFFH